MPRRTRDQKHTLEEAEEFASMRAKLIIGLNAMPVVREGRQFIAFIEDRARGFSQEEAATARDERWFVFLLLAVDRRSLESELPVRASGETVVIVELIECLFS
eukprot:3903751-Amphidinium_carterae.1